MAAGSGKTLAAFCHGRSEISMIVPTTSTSSMPSAPHLQLPESKPLEGEMRCAIVVLSLTDLPRRRKLGIRRRMSSEEHVSRRLHHVVNYGCTQARSRGGREQDTRHKETKQPLRSPRGPWLHHVRYHMCECSTNRIYMGMQCSSVAPVQEACMSAVICSGVSAIDRHTHVHARLHELISIPNAPSSIVIAPATHAYRGV
jgi:hypothetical protein